MKYLFVTQHKKTWPIDLMCRVLGVSRQGYYHYQRNTEARLAGPDHQEMLEWVKDIAIASPYSYGRRRMKNDGDLVAQAKGGLIHHSDRGSQYASKAFRTLLKAHGIKSSMSHKGDY